MEIGQKVRFLNEVGGGVISGFQGKDIVLVEDEDGFDIPMLRSQVVVIETNANNFERPNPGQRQQQREAQKPKAAPEYGSKPATQQPTADSTAPRRRYLNDDEDYDPADRPVTFRPKPVERKGGDLLNVMLAFIPENVRELTSTRFESYLINDSNYYLSVMMATAEGAAWHLRWQTTMEPNTKTLIESFDRSELNSLERIAVQVVAWKQDKPFMLKQPIGVELRLDMVKFYKLHVFQTTPFFHEPALLYDLVRDDHPVRKVFAEATDLVEEVDTQQQEAQIEEAPQLEEPAAAPQLTREQERQALKDAKRALKAQQQAEAARQLAAKMAEAPREHQLSKPNHHSGEDVVEVDLHITALLDNTAGLSNSVLLNTQLTEFRIVMERYKAKKGQRIVFIHGKGDGVLRDAILKELHQRYRHCTAQDASFREYGYGATMVTIH